MIRLSPPDFDFVQVERPVQGDVKPFLAKAHAIGERILGKELVGSISDFGMIAEDDNEMQPEPTYVATQVGNSIMEVAGTHDLSFVLLHRSVPHDLSSRYGILSARRTLARPYISKYQDVTTASGKMERAEIRQPGLPSKLAEISLSHELDPDETPIYFNRVEVIGEPGKNIVLGLLPAPALIATRALHEQAKAAARHLMTYNKDHRRLSYPVTPSQVAIPFARFPGTVSDRNYELLLEELQRKLLPQRFVLGSPRVTSS